MLLQQLHHSLMSQPTQLRFTTRTFLWLTLSFAFSFLCSSFAFKEAFSSQYVIQEDALQHVFWMRRFLDPDLFPNDLIADYFQSVAPWGYTAFYWGFARIGVDPVYLSKLLPPILGLITTGYGFWICLEIFPVPMAGFLSSVLLNQFLWLRDDIVSGTPTAFVYPFFTAFLYYLLRRSLIQCIIAITLLGLFYPQAVLIAAGVLFLQFFDWKRRESFLRKDVSNIRFCTTGLGVALLVILIYAFKSSEFGPVITVAEAQTMPEFAPDGKTKFFFKNPFYYWLISTRSGIVPTFPAFGHVIGLLSFPFLLRFSDFFPLLRKFTSKTYLLLEVTLVSVGLFFLAHATLFRLHLPSRYTEHSLRIVIAILAGVALTILINRIFHYFNSKKFWQWSLTLCLLVFLIINPFFFDDFNINEFPVTKYFIGEEPVLYDFFKQQPKDIVIASLAEEASFIPTFTQRSVLVGRRAYPVPYHTGYYGQIRQRTIDLVDAQYSLDLAQVQQFQQKYSVDFWLLEESAFSPEYLSENNWLTDYPSATNRALKNLQQDLPPAITRTLNQCAALKTGDYYVLEATCIQNLSGG